MTNQAIQNDIQVNCDAEKRYAQNVLMENFLLATAELVEFYSGNPTNFTTVEHNIDVGAKAIGLDSVSASDETMTSSIGLANDEFACSICLVANSEVLQEFYQGNLQNPTDWIGELANQCAGRMKNLLTDFGVSAVLTTPVSICGLKLAIPVQTSETSIFKFESSAGKLVALINIQVDSHVQWERNGETECAEEGSLHMF